jgi:hypothetical protein
MNDLQKCACNDKEKCIHSDLKKPGIYIWGFLYKKGCVEDSVELNQLCGSECFKKYNWEIVNCDKNELEKALKEIQLATEQNEICSNYLFISYYVGISTSKQGVKERLDEHKKMDNGHSAKYVRLKDEFMLCYHKHVFSLYSKKKPSSALPVFPILKGSLNNNHVWTLLANQGYVYHFNRQSACMLIDHNKNSNIQFNQSIENGNYSINDYSRAFGNNDWIIQNDPLKNRVKKDGDNNFWFTYCEIEDSSLIDYIKSKFNDVESKKVKNESELTKLRRETGKNESELTELREKIKLIKEKPEKIIARLQKDHLEKKNRTLNKDIQNLEKQIENLKKQLEILNEDKKELEKKDEGDHKEKVRKKYFHQAESATYFALRGITFSRTHTVEFPEGWNIENNSGFDIFLNNASQKTLGKNNPRTCDLEDEYNWPGYW